MRTVFLATAMLLAGALPATASDWSTLPAMPTARFGAGAAVLGSDYYVIGGSAATDLADANVWNATSGTWSAVNPMSMTRQFPGTVALGGRLYAIGGYGPGGVATTSAERFDPGTGNWSPIAPLPDVRALAGVATVNGMIYVLSGEGAAGVPQENCFRYDPSSNTWSGISGIVPGRSGAAAAVLNNEIYLMGGASGLLLSNVDIYTPATGAWRPGSALPEPLWMPSAATFEGRIWVMGGFDGGFNRSDRVYSMGTDGVWRAETSLPLALAGAAAASDGMRMVVAGGMNSNGQPVAAAVERMSDLPPPPPPPPPASADTLFCHVEVAPHVLNLKSFGRWISADISSETGDVGAIDVSSLTLEGVAVDMDAPWSLDDGVLSVKFPRADFAFLADGELALKLEGHTSEGVAVYGEGSVLVSGGHSKRPVNQPMPAMKPGRGNGRLAASSVQFSLEAPAAVTMDVLDVQGRRLERIADGTFSAGTHEIEWAGSRRAAAGVYFVRARFDGAMQVMRFAVIR